MLNDRIIAAAFIISFIGHSLFLGLPGLNMNSAQFDKPEEVAFNVEIEKCPLLPKIDITGEEKKLKETVKRQESSELKSDNEPPVEAAVNTVMVLQPQRELQTFTPLEKNLLREQAVCDGNNSEPSSVFSKEQVKIDIIAPEQEQMLRYQDMVKQKIEEARRYPLWARKQSIEGIVYINFIVLSNGLSQDVKIIRSAGSKSLDEEAVETIKRANPFPPIPKEINTAQVQMEVAIVFNLK